MKKDCITSDAVFFFWLNTGLDSVRNLKELSPHVE